MPDVIIKGMEKIPMACCECPCVNGNFCGAKNERPTFEEWYERKPDWCPLHPAPEWISVEKRLPEDFQKVLVFWWEHGEPMIDTAFWQRDAKRFDGQHWVRMEDKVTHWMPLPEPPEGGGGDG